MEKWLKDLIEEIKKESEKDVLKELKEKPLNFSMKIEAGENIADINIDVEKLLDNVVVPAKLFKMGFEGIEKTLKSLDIPLQKDCLIKGYSESEYKIPFYLEDKKRLILIEPMMVSGIIEVLGLGSFANALFSPFLALEFFKYIDIMNAQNKPTIMAFIGLTNFNEVTNVNFFDFLNSTVTRMQPKSETSDSQNRKPQDNVFEFLPKNVFKIYGIPDFKVPFVDGLQLSRYDPNKTIEMKKLRAYTQSMGMLDFLNPSVVDYALFTTGMAGRAKPQTIEQIMKGGEALGHSPSKSNIVPDIIPTDVMEDPLALLSELKSQGMVAQITGKYKLTAQGIRMVSAEVTGKPKETSLTKVWNVVKKAKEILPFLKFL